MIHNKEISWMKRALVFSIGILVALLVLEAGLRIVGLVHGIMEGQDHRMPSIHGQDAKVVLCLGNSYTQGVGASSGMSYPEQLQRMLDLRKPGSKFVVVNEGHGAQSTSELLTDLPRNLDRVMPALVVLQTGEANQWNYLGYENYLKRENGLLSWTDGVQELLRRIFYESRVYRLLVLASEHLKNRDFLRRPSLGSDQSYLLDEAYRDAVQYVTNLNSPFVDLTRIPFDAERVLTTRRVLLQAIEKDPENFSNYILIGDTYRSQKQYEQAVSWYIRSLEVDPELRRGDVLHRGYHALRQARHQDKGADNEKLNQRIDDFIKSFKKRHSEKAKLLFSLDTHHVMSWIESDLREIVGILQARKIPFLVQNYPIDTMANNAVAKTVQSMRLSFVDQKRIFDRRLMQDPSRDRYFGADNHCNDAGYGLMAENVYQGIVDAGF
ncbi:MAG: hypothetical protein V1882_09975 [Candidatus Omnitrophota bacterium]